MLFLEREFQHTAARRRLQPLDWLTKGSDVVSTHSRPKAAADHNPDNLLNALVSTHSRPKAAANIEDARTGSISVSTHSRPKAAAFKNVSERDL